MAKVKIKFFEGAARVGLVTLEQAQEIFGWIEKSQRYSFNKSHAVSYGINGYISAFLKCHFPIQFFTSWLFYSQYKSEPQQEVRELVNDAKLLDVKVATPNIINMEPHFSTDGKIVTFGLADVKGIGDSHIAKLQEVVPQMEVALAKPIKDWTWYEFLTQVSGKLSATIVTRLISVGALRNLHSCRNQMLAEYKAWDQLTAKEQEWIVKHAGNFTNVLDALEAVAPSKDKGGGTHGPRRQELVKSLASLLRHPPTAIQDIPSWIAWTEEDLLGIAITCSKVDSCDTTSINCSCKDLLAGKSGFLLVGVEINAVRETKIKNGQQIGRKMAFVTVSDSSCSVEMIAFPDAWKAYSLLLNTGNTVAIQVRKDKLKESFLIEKVFQI